MTPTRLIQITEADGRTHDMIYRTADLGILYSEEEQARLFTGLPVWRSKPDGYEKHIDLEAAAERIAEEREAQDDPLFPITAAIVVIAAAITAAAALYTFFPGGNP